MTHKVIESQFEKRLDRIEMMLSNLCEKLQICKQVSAVRDHNTENEIQNHIQNKNEKLDNDVMQFLNFDSHETKCVLVWYQLCNYLCY